MPNLQVRVNNTPLVLGGNVNSRLRLWLKNLGVQDFHHLAMNVKSITPSDIQMSADYIRREYSHYQYIFTVGVFADKVLKLAGIDHGTFPPTSVRDPAIINHAMQVCRNYLMRSMYHAPTIDPNISG